VVVVVVVAPGVSPVSELTEMGESLDWMGLVAEGRAGGEFGWEPQRLGRVRLYYW